MATKYGKGRKPRSCRGQIDLFPSGAATATVEQRLLLPEPIATAEPQTHMRQETEKRRFVGERETVERSEEIGRALDLLGRAAEKWVRKLCDAAPFEMSGELREIFNNDDMRDGNGLPTREAVKAAKRIVSAAMAKRGARGGRWTEQDDKYARCATCHAVLTRLLKAHSLLKEGSFRLFLDYVAELRGEKTTRGPRSGKPKSRDCSLEARNDKQYKEAVAVVRSVAGKAWRTAEDAHPKPARLAEIVADAVAKGSRVLIYANGWDMECEQKLAVQIYEVLGRDMYAKYGKNKPAIAVVTESDSLPATDIIISTRFFTDWRIGAAKPPIDLIIYFSPSERTNNEYPAKTLILELK